MAYGTACHFQSHCCCCRMLHVRWDVSHLTADSSAEGSRIRPPSSFVRGQDSTMWDIVCTSPRGVWRGAVFLSDDSIVIKWLQEHGLLLGRMCCTRCDNWDMHLQTCKSSIDGITWRCNYGHEISIRRNSFFENSYISLRDIMLFVYEF